MSSDAVFRRADGVVAASVDGDVVLMSPTDSRCYALTGSAEAVWDLLSVDRTPESLVADLTERFVVDPERCMREVSALLADMEGAGVVQRSAGTTA